MKSKEIINLNQIRQEEESARQNTIFFTYMTFIAVIFAWIEPKYTFLVVLMGIVVLSCHIEIRYWSTKYYQLKYFNWVKR